MSIIDSFLSIIAPHTCLGCDTEGTLLCKHCAQQIEKPPKRCYRCHRLTSDAQTCISCRSSSKLYRVRAAHTYDGLAKNLTASLKFNGAQAAASTMALAMLHDIQLPSTAVLVPVPTTSDRHRQRGYDQAVLLAQELSRSSHCPMDKLLVRMGSKHQVGASRHQRLTQLRQAFRIKREINLEGAHVILVDDVCTTGATLEAAAKVIKQAGAARVEAMVYAQA